MTPEDLHKAEYLIGPWLIGSFVDILFQGVLFCQFAHYFEFYRDDKPQLWFNVFGLMVITTLKSIQAFALAWIQNVLYFNDLDGAVLLSYTTWWQSGNPLMVACIALYVQAFFLHRLYRVSGNNSWVVAPITVLILFAFCSICLATYYITKGADYGPKIALWFAANLATAFAGDLSITCSIAFFLLRSKKYVLPRTSSAIDYLVRLTISSAAPASLCAMFNLIFSQVYSGSNVLISTAFNQALPKLYAMSMMWTLNARRNNPLRRFQECENFSTRPTRNDVELHSCGGVHVHTETSRQMDLAKIRGMIHNEEVETLQSTQELRKGEEVA